jgi:2-polyprenyl-3-methyl-5-hydroxy-6-metoxy-1,4-benzoquinol methylase
MLQRAYGAIDPSMAHAVKTIVADIQEYRSEERFDCILCIGVLAHMRQLKETLNRVSSMLSPGGILILQWTDYRTMAGKLFHFGGRMMKYCRPVFNETIRTRKNDIEETLAVQGLVADKTARYFFIPGIRYLPIHLPTWLVERVCARFPLCRIGSEYLVKYQKNNAAAESLPG